MKATEAEIRHAVGLVTHHAPELAEDVRACRVCGAAAGVACDPERLGKAGRRGATAHRDR